MKYFFDRKIAIPKGMLEDCHPFPMPTRAYLEDPQAGSKYAPSKKKKVRTKPDRELWRDHLAISIGSDLQGLTFHHHREAWNIVIFGKKRWILWDHARWKDNNTIQWRTTRDWASGQKQISGADWIRRLYPEPEREYEIRNYGHDCIQHAGQMMFVPERWMHMVVNIGDTVSVISEVGLGIGEGKKPEDFLHDPYASSDDSDEESEDESSGDDINEGGPPTRGSSFRDSPPPEDDDEDWSSDDSEEWSSDDIEAVIKTCPVCSGGLTVSEHRIIPYPEANGASCGQLLEFAAAGVRREVCNEMMLAEATCCPPPAATS